MHLSPPASWPGLVYGSKYAVMPNGLKPAQQGVFAGMSPSGAALFEIQRGHRTEVARIAEPCFVEISKCT